MRIRLSFFMRVGISIFFLLIVYEGALRKWLVPEYSQLVFVLKDITLAVAFGALLLAKGLNIPKGLYRTFYGTVLIIFLSYGVVEIFNPTLPNIMLGIWGFKSHFLYASLIILIPSSFQSLSQLKKYLYWYLLLSIPVLIICLFQFYLPLDHPINVYARSSHVNFLPSIMAPRVTGTFSSNAGMGSYSFLATYLAFLFILMERGKLTWLTLPYHLTLIVGGVVMFMTGGRWPFFAWATVLVVWGFCALFFLTSGQILLNFIRVRFVVSILLIVTLGYFLMTFYATDAVNTTLERFYETTEGTQNRLVERVTQPYFYSDESGLIGHGIGSTYQAAHVLTSVPHRSWFADHIKIEEALEREMLELGIIGFLMVVLHFLALYILSWSTLGILVPYQAKILGIGGFSYLLLGFTEQIVYHPYTSSFFWGFAGIIVALRSWALTHPRKLQTK